MKKDDAFFKNVLNNLSEGVYFVDQERNITFWNKAAEQITGFTAEEVLGKPCGHNILRHVDDLGTELCKELCPLAHTLKDSRPREAEVFLYHKKGHRVPVHIRISPHLDEQGNITGAVEVFSDNSRQLDMIERVKELEEMSFLDQLTMLPNRRHIENYLEDRIEFFNRYGFNFGVLFMDIDKFKLVNDRFGHSTGDDVLKTVARTMIGNIRGSDLVGRWGGEEFVGIFNHMEKKKLCAIGHKLLALVRTSGVRRGKGDIRVTISIGATLVKKGDTPQTIIERADRLMFLAKKKGRDIITYEPAD
jgi:diguanylate cyclase (GGDEF)-like protein/PAS domain S-box-containing protein